MRHGSRRWHRLCSLALVVALSVLSAAPAGGSAEPSAQRPATSKLTAPHGQTVAAQPAAALGAVANEPNFPPKDSRYHNYPEMVAHIHRVAAAHPGIVKLFNIGSSYEGRTIWAAKVSDNVQIDEAEPEVLFDGLHHAGEHLSAEMTIAILDLLTSNYGRAGALGRRVTSLVNSREIWIVFMVNPDGSQYSLTGNPYRPWRKNRQPTPDPTEIGTDLNRNYDYHWGCCGGSGRKPFRADYRGPRPFSAPETRVMRDFILSRIVGGRQQIKVSATFHIPGHLVLWPYGYTSKPVPPDMTQLDHRTFVALGQAMAARNGYLPLQWGAGRRTSGSAIDWQYGTQRIFSFLIELGDSDKIPDERIKPETSRNRDAILYLIGMAGCPYAAVGGKGQFCGPFFDDLEVSRGWRPDPDGSDTATDGTWARGIPRANPGQLGTAISGRSVLATGLTAGHDVDGGTTTVRSPVIQVPAGGASLHLRYWVGLGANATAGDSFGIRLVARDGTTLARALTVHGDGTLRAPHWQALDYSIATKLAGKNLSIELVARDAGADSRVEAGVDDVRITTP
jgi:carboxypeptidase T